MVQHRWRVVSFILLGSVAHSLASIRQSFENTAIVRSVDLGGSVVHVTTTYAIKATQGNSAVYTIVLGSAEKEKTSWLEVKVKGQQEALPIHEHPVDPSRCVQLLIYK